MIARGIQLVYTEDVAAKVLEYTGGDRGWIGDNPFIFLDTKKIQSTGWKPKLTIEQGILRTLSWLQQNQWVYEKRS